MSKHYERSEWWEMESHLGSPAVQNTQQTQQSDLDLIYNSEEPGMWTLDDKKD